MTDSSSRPLSARVGETLIRWLGRARSRGSALRARAEPVMDALPGLLLVTGLGALSGTVLVFILNHQLTAAAAVPSVGVGVIFLLVVIVYRGTQKLVISRAGALVEQALHTRRIRVVNEIFQLTLSDTESLTRGRAIDGMTRHYSTLSQSVFPLVQGLQSVMFSACLLAYLCWLSPAAGALAAAVACLLWLGVGNGFRQWMAQEGRINQSSSRLSRLTEQMLDGFKELRLNQYKRHSLRTEVDSTCAEIRDLRADIAHLMAVAFALVAVIGYLLLGAIIILWPILSKHPLPHGSQLATVTLFLVGPMLNMATMAHQVGLARFALEQIDKFEAQVLALALAKPAAAEVAVPTAFEHIGLQGLGYTHASAKEGAPAFSLADLSLELRRGTITFITGLNGSGKTTLLRLLTGLYSAHSGHLTVDGIALPSDPGQAYRDYFSCVFADNHLFSQPYGLDAAGLERLSSLLQHFDIAQKLPADLAGGYDPASLSTGQRKRLALALALAEDRPVLVLDEWAADQDAASRKAFYTTVLPGLKAEGKTVVAVTHDERYFEVADVHYEIKDGQLTLAGAE